VVDALALEAEEGRGALRKAQGSGRARVDPGVPEWGNPPACRGPAPPAESIGVAEGTGGTETS